MSSPSTPVDVTVVLPVYNEAGHLHEELDRIRASLQASEHTYELLVVDDGTESIADLVPVNDRVRYVRFDQKLTIGAKRNLANEKARGEFIVHWDDDDWYPSWRVRAQVKALIDGDARRASALVATHLEEGKRRVLNPSRFPAA